MDNDELKGMPLNDATQEALAEKFRAEATVQLAVAAKEQAWADTAKAEAARNIAEHERYAAINQQQRDVYLASDKFYRIYQFGGPAAFKVSDTSVFDCINMLNYWHRTDENDGVTRPMEIVFYSPGGEVLSGMRLFDHIRWLGTIGHDITTTTMGYAASMGGVLLQAGKTRKMGRESSVLIHELQYGAQGDSGDMEDAVERANMIQKRIIAIFCGRAKDTGRPGYLTPAVMKRRWKRKDWWLDSDECYRLGIVDEII